MVFSGVSLFCLQVFGGVFNHYRWGMVAIGEWGEQKLGLDDVIRETKLKMLDKNEIK